MSEPGARPAPRGSQQAAVPEGLVSAVVNLVGTGPVLLGAYTVAELTAVDAVVDFLQAPAPARTSSSPAATAGCTS